MEVPLFPKDASPFALVFELHSRLLRLASDAAGLHFCGLQQASRHLKKNELIDAPTANKLANLDLCYNWMRHITTAKAVELEKRVREKLAAPPARTCRADAPPFVPELRLAGVLPPPGLAEPALPSVPPLAALVLPSVLPSVSTSATGLPLQQLVLRRELELLAAGDQDDVNIGTYPSGVLSPKLTVTPPVEPLAKEPLAPEPLALQQKQQLQEPLAPGGGDLDEDAVKDSGDTLSPAAGSSCTDGSVELVATKGDPNCYVAS